MRRAFLAAALAAAVAVAVPVLATGRTHETPTYYGAVAPLLGEHCTSCHVDGGVAPFALTSAKDAQRYARAIAAAVKTGTMPPWMPGRDSPAFIGQSARV